MKKTIFCILLLLAIMICFSGCDTAQTQELKYEDNTIPLKYYVEIARTMTYIIAYDPNTKVMYHISNGHDNRGTATVLLNENGNPLLYEGR